VLLEKIGLRIQAGDAYRPNAQAGSPCAGTNFGFDLDDLNLLHKKCFK
jgi:hypothetical protein